MQSMLFKNLALVGNLFQLRKKVLIAFLALFGALSQSYADDLSYIDDRFPYKNLQGKDRLKKAAECTWSGDGRCYMVVVAEILRNFRVSNSPDPTLNSFKLGYFTTAVSNWDYDIEKVKGRGPWTYLSSAIYYGHKNILQNRNCNLDDTWGINGALSDLDSVNFDQAQNPSEAEDLQYFVQGFQDFYRQHCAN